MWHWLVQEGLYRDVLAAIVGVAITTVAGWRPFRKWQKNARKTADMLDTTTPGGLTDVLNAIIAERLSDGSGD